ncbi:MAG: dockerin type I repeat-containing protein [Ruminococcus sp.]|nr:dockerin type I repeat-containing protein [Ruminococcus sp.]
MKKAVNRLISLAVSAIMLFCTAVSGVSAEELGTYDAVVSIVYPRPDEAPQKPVITESGTEIETLGSFWEESSTGYAKLYDHPVLTWMMGIEGFEGYNGQFTTFTDADMYDISILAKIENYTGLSSNQGVATFVDADTGETINTGNVHVISVSAMLTMLGSEAELPDGLTTSDALVMISIDSELMCSPEGHLHESSGYAYDDNQHWYKCECGVALRGTSYDHSCVYTINEPWQVVKNATETESGLWEKKCYCGHTMETVIIPPKSEQTIVSTYEELQSALAEGGKQWITLNVSASTKWAVQSDMEYNNMLVLDDPSAEIVLDMNGCGLARETGRYDKSLFDIRAGSLRIISKSVATPTDSSNNLHFSSASSEDCVFYVHEGASLRLTNVSAISPSDEWAYSCPSVISEGNLQIDGGSYYLYDNEFTPSTSEYALASIVLDGGTAVINSGTFDGKGCGVLVRGDTKLTINDGYFYSWYYGLYQRGNSKVIINGGVFGDDEEPPSFGFYMDGGTARIYSGSFYGNTAGAYAISGDICISGGYFKMMEDTGYGAFSFNVTDVSAEIIRGDFRGAKGISTRWDLFDEFTETSPDKYIAYGSTARDSGKSIDLSELTTHIGEYYLEITTTKPVFTLQPEDVSIYEGGSAQFRVKAKNADSYCWYIADADDDSLQPYDWSDVESFCDVSGIESDTLIIKNAGSWLNNKAVYCEAYNGSYKLSDAAVITVKQIVRGDVNADDKFNIADAVMLQNYLVRRRAVTLWTAGDLSEDGKLDIFDLCIMKNALAELS